MAQSYFAEEIKTTLGSFKFIENVSYPNGGFSEFYVLGQTIIIIDFSICKVSPNLKLFPYNWITEKQNFYMKKYKSVFRFMIEDFDQIDKILKAQKDFSIKLSKRKIGNRSYFADSSPLEFLFEEAFIQVYGPDSIKYLYKEYEIIGPDGQNYFIDYLVKTTEGEIAVEENGVHYHHPQEIGIERYRKQLLKQNTCTLWGIKLFRFSTEDCCFKERMEDDIRSFFGNDTSTFLENGIILDRKFKLYKHQKDTLLQIAKKREEGIKSFLVVFPTASGKSKIIEEDLLAFTKANGRSSALILVPNSAIKNDWKKRIESSLQNLRNYIQIETFAYAVRHYTETNQKQYNYIVVDEAHHAVAPMLKRVIQYYTPDFLIGLTATDQRPDKKKLEEVFGTYKTPLSLEDAMKKKIIAEAYVYRVETNIDLSKVRINGKDYVNADLEKSIRVTSRNELIAQILQEYFTKGIAGKRQGIIFCVNINHAHEMENVLNSYGLNAKAYTNRTLNTEEVLQDFKEKKIRFLCACNMISEGWDYPELGLLVMARPTLSKVLYLQQLGRGLRRTDSKQNVFVIDVVDSYGSAVIPVSMHSIFHLEQYAPFGSVLKRDYKIGDFITIDGLPERIERIVPVETHSFAEKYADYLSQEQLAREYFVSTDTISNWVRRGKIKADVTFTFGSRRIHLFSPINVRESRIKLGIKVHDDTTIRQDFFDFLEERDYSLSYKMPFMLGFLRNMNSIGDADIDRILDYYISFYEHRIEQGLLLDRKTCPYNLKTLKNRTEIKRSMLANPFEKFERKRFFYYSQDLNIISMNHALFSSLNENDIKRIGDQMHEDLKNYYKSLNSEYTKEVDYTIHNEEYLKVADSSSS